MEALHGFPQVDEVARQQAQVIMDMASRIPMGTADRTATVTALTRGPWPEEILHGMLGAVTAGGETIETFTLDSGL